MLELLNAFGKVKAFHLVKNEPDAMTSKGYCFVEYADPNVTQVAVVGLNGMDLGGGKMITARVAGQRAGAVAVAATPNLAQQQASLAPLPAGVRPNTTIVGGYDIEELVDAAMGLRPMPIAPAHMDQFGLPMTRVAPVLSIPIAQTPAQQVSPPAPVNGGLPVGSSALDIANAALDAAFGGGGASNPGAGTNDTITNTRILVLLNMVTDEDLATDEDYNGLVEEVQEECAKHGKLLGLKVPRSPSSKIQPSAIKKIFLEYATVHDANNAKNQLSGRQFGPNVVEVSREYPPCVANTMFLHTCKKI